MGTWVAPAFWLLGIMLLRTWGYLLEIFLSVLSGIYPEVELLNLLVNLCLTLGQTRKVALHVSGIPRTSQQWLRSKQAHHSFFRLLETILLVGPICHPCPQTRQVQGSPILASNHKVDNTDVSWYLDYVYINERKISFWKYFQKHLREQNLDGLCWGKKNEMENSQAF